jgi:pSer/pThr/pTyr-binding forkhead associated (FHA) protein
MSSPKAYKHPDSTKNRQKTKFSDWFKERNDLKAQRPFALVTPNFVNARVLADNKKTAIIPTSIFEKLAKEIQPRLLTRESLKSFPELSMALEQAWGRMPRFCLIVPVREAVACSIAILGRQQKPEPALLATLVTALQERSFEANQLSDLDMADIQRLRHNSAPTIVVDGHGRPVLINEAAAEFYGDSRTPHLEHLLGRFAAGQLQRRRDELFTHRQLCFEAQLSLLKGTWRVEINASVLQEAIAIALTDLKEINEVIPRLPPIDSRIGKTPKESRTSRMIPRGNILCWLHCDPLPPLAIGPKFEITLGRKTPNDLILAHASVSRTHAAIKVRGSTVILEDLSSANGTYVNGRRSNHHTICIGDRIQIGPYEIVVREPTQRTQIRSCETTVFTQISFMNRDTALAGSLAETPLVELLQSLEFNQKTGSLTVISGKQGAFFSVVDGLPHSAQMGEIKDTEAVMALLLLHEGYFTFSNKAPKEEKTMNVTITSLLLEASRRIDEGSSASVELRDMNR